MEYGSIPICVGGVHSRVRKPLSGKDREHRISPFHVFIPRLIWTRSSAGELPQWGNDRETSQTAGAFQTVTGKGSTYHSCVEN